MGDIVSNDANNDESAIEIQKNKSVLIQKDFKQVNKEKDIEKKENQSINGKQHTEHFINNFFKKIKTLDDGLNNQTSINSPRKRRHREKIDLKKKPRLRRTNTL